jgi:hypothetical protein
MMNLAEYRRHLQCLADFLPWAALVAPGIVLNKDGSFQRTARFRGPDLDSATPAELVATTARFNNVLRRLGSGWAIFIEAQRVPANRYPESRFPDAASRLVDAERRAQFEEEGAHFESRYFLTLLWLPPADDAARAEAWLYEGRAQEEGADWRASLVGFVDRSDRVLALIEGFMPEAEWLDDGETLTYLLRHGGVGREAGWIAPRLAPRNAAPRVAQAEADQHGDKVQSKQQERGTPHAVDTSLGEWDRTQHRQIVRGCPSKADGIPSRDAQPGTGS